MRRIVPFLILPTFLAPLSPALLPPSIERSWLISNFPPHVRMTSINISYNLAVSLVGGFAPAVATILVDRYGNASPGFVITGLAVLAWIGLWVGSKGAWSDAVPTAEVLYGREASERNSEFAELRVDCG